MVAPGALRSVVLSTSVLCISVNFYTFLKFKLRIYFSDTPAIRVAYLIGGAVGNALRWTSHTSIIPVRSFSIYFRSGGMNVKMV